MPQHNSRVNFPTMLIYTLLTTRTIPTKPYSIISIRKKIDGFAIIIETWSSSSALVQWSNKKDVMCVSTHDKEQCRMPSWISALILLAHSTFITRLKNIFLILPSAQNNQHWQHWYLFCFVARWEPQREITDTETPRALGNNIALYTTARNHQLKTKASSQGTKRLLLIENLSMGPPTTSGIEDPNRRCILTRRKKSYASTNYIA